MSVTNYTPSSSACKYNYSKLKDVIYLVSKNHTKNVYIDNGEAYIDGLTELPLRLNGFNISLNEESSLDERYAFKKTVTLSMHGYVSSSIFGGRYYVILESYDGTFWMVNEDFPARLTYTFNLSKDIYQTDFTLSLMSNFPTLRLVSDFEAVSPVCLGFNVYGIRSLKLLEKDYCTLESVHKMITTYGKSFQDVDFLGDSCSFQETFDGEKATTTISFDIGFDAYKSSWHYNLLEFVQNLYAAIVVPKGNDNTFFAGFNFGLQPSFVVQTQSNEGQSDIITITLIEASNHGSTAAKSWSEEQSTDTMWTYVKWVNGIKCYECIALGRARFLVQQEVTPNGVPTGNYKCLTGYESYFTSQGLNIVGTFSNQEEFSESECTGALCKVNTNLPSTITYYEPTCYTYSYSASCDWNVTGLANYMTVTPSSGVANSAYTLTVCNSKTPTSTESSTFTIKAGDNVRVVNVLLTIDTSILRPQQVNINCLEQTVRFTFNANCPITVTSIDSRLTYQITNSQLVVNVPRNNSISSGITWEITVEDCHGNTQTVTILQDKTYEQWITTSDYLCENGNSYVKENRYTGTTANDINTPTGESRKGDLIKISDPRCKSSQTRWVFDNHYYCVNGDKYKAEEEEISYDNGSTWSKTGVTRLGELVEADSDFCDETLNPVSYEWRLTQRWQCDYTPTPPPSQPKWIATYSGGTTSSAECDASSAITEYEVAKTGLVAIQISNCVTSIGDAAFESCTRLTSCTIGNGVTSIGEYAFMECHRLASITIPDSVTSIGDDAFDGCTGLTSCTIGSGVTTIGNYAFAHCYSLQSITVNAEIPPNLNGYDVFNDTNNCVIYVPSDSVNIYKLASGWSDYASRIQAIP